ncbi:hypothetical protein GF337_05185 [candidate division KSB1 bacterium]|nr:hypothetical protein [candidate division KSB1 bacterium]
MDLNIVLGLIVFAVAYGFLLFFILWSRRTIELIDDRKLTSLREIIEELRRGK